MEGGRKGKGTKFRSVFWMTGWMLVPFIELGDTGEASGERLYKLRLRCLWGIRVQIESENWIKGSEAQERDLI